MKNIALFLALVASLSARPPVELVTSNTTMDDFNPLLRAWRRENKHPLAPQPILFVGNEQFAEYKAGDTALWVRYADQSIVKGDLIVYVSSQSGLNIIREVRSVSPLRTTRNFDVPAAKVVGIVRRVVRLR